MRMQTVYLWFPGNAAEALRFYQGVFGGRLALHTFADFGRDDGPVEAIAHGVLSGPVELYATDATQREATLEMRGISIALLGAADPATSTHWFAELAVGGEVLDDLKEHGWGASDGQLVDRYGVRWLIGFEQGAGDENAASNGSGVSNQRQ